MPFNGVGVFTPVYDWETDAANGILVRADRMTDQDDDIGDGLSTCMLKDGTQIMTANIPMSSFKFTDLAAGSSPNDSVRFVQVFTSPAFDGTPTAPTASTGTSTTQLATTAFVANTAFSTGLPAQTGNAGNIVTTDGTNGSWVSVLALPEIWM